MLPIILGSIHFFIFTKICVLHSRLFSALVALLACSFLFNTLLHFPDFIKMDPKYVNDVLPVISMLCSSFISCMSIHTFKYSVLRICSFKPHFLYSFNFFVVYSASTLSCAVITWSSAKRWWFIVFIPDWQSHTFARLVPVIQYTL